MTQKGGGEMTPWCREPARCCAQTSTRCNAKVALRASSNEALTDSVRAHGASVHGFTPVWYSRERIARIAASADVSIIPMPW